MFYNREIDEKGLGKGMGWVKKDMKRMHQYEGDCLQRSLEVINAKLKQRYGFLFIFHQPSGTMFSNN
jgi:hypothetical protein